MKYITVQPTKRTYKTALRRILAALLSLLLIATTILPQAGIAAYIKTKAAIHTLQNPVRDADGNVTWDCVWFGSYPQTEIVSEEDTTQLAAMEKMNTDYETKYETVSASAYRQIAGASYNSNGDATVNGVKYRRMKKGDATYTSTSSSYYQWSDSESYHYFRYEPIKWRVLSVNGSDAVLLSDIGLDDKRYNETYTDITWETSTMRSWLNGYPATSNKNGKDYSSNNFLDSAFSSAEQAAIHNSAVVNADNPEYGTDGGSDTTDKVFLLSIDEGLQSDYGFSENYSVSDKTRQAKTSTYAKAMGCWGGTSAEHAGCADWWLRSSGCSADSTADVDSSGSLTRYGRYVGRDNGAVRPALHLNLSSSSLYSYAGTVCSEGTADEEEPGHVPGGGSGGGNSSTVESNHDIIKRVEEYTSDEIYAQYTAIEQSDCSQEWKQQKYYDLFTSYGFTDVREGIQYLSNCTQKRYAYLNLITDDAYCAKSYQYWLDNTTKGHLARALLVADGLVFNNEVNDWLSFDTYAQSDYPGVSKYKEMLYDFMDATSDSIEVMSDIKLVNGLAKNVTGAAKLRADYLVQKLNDCKTVEEAQKLMESNDTKAVFTELTSKTDDSGNPVFSFKLDETSGFGQFAKASKYAAKGVSLMNLSYEYAKDFMTLDSRLAVYAQYKTFLEDVVNNTSYLPFQLRWAVQQILDEMEEGYAGILKDIAFEILSMSSIDSKAMEAIIGKTGASTFAQWLLIINIDAYFINKLADVGAMVKKEAYVEGYAYLSSAFKEQLEQSKKAFLSNKTEQNAWQFYYNYNMLYRLRYKGEEAYLAFSKVDGLAGVLYDFGYSAKKLVVQDTLNMLEQRCRFDFEEDKALPVSCQYAAKAVISCPVNVTVCAEDGTPIVKLTDKTESDTTNEYGRFAVRYNAWLDDYQKILCFSSDEDYKIKIEGIDDGLVTLEAAQQNEEHKIYSFRNAATTSDTTMQTTIKQLLQEHTYSVDWDGDGEPDSTEQAEVIGDGYIPAESLALDTKELELVKGDNGILHVAVSPDAATSKAVTWVSNHPEIAAVKDGKVTAISAGEAAIYAIASDNTDIMDICKVTVRGDSSVEDNHEETEPKNVKEAACTEAGYTGDVYCKTCGELIKQGEAVAALGHDWDTVWSRTDAGHFKKCRRTACEEVTALAGHVYEWIIDTPATVEAEGVKHEECRECGYAKGSVTIAKLGQGSNDKGDTNGGNSGNKEDSNNMHSNTGVTSNLSVDNRLASTTEEKAGVTAPKRAVIKKLKVKGNVRLKVTFKKIKGARGYQIAYATNKKFKGAKTVTTKKLSYTLKKLKKNKRYYVRVRAYKLSDGKKIYGKWSTVKKKKMRR